MQPRAFCITTQLQLPAIAQAASLQAPQKRLFALEEEDIDKRASELDSLCSMGEP